jgi:hypothetical protein
MDRPAKDWADILHLSYENDNPSLRGVYRGDSRYTHWRQEKKLATLEATVVKSCRKLDEFFKPGSDVIKELDTVENLQEGQDKDEQKQEEHQEKDMEEQQNDGSQQWQDEGDANDEKKNEENEDKTSKNRKMEEEGLTGESGKELLESLKEYLKRSQRISERHHERIYAVKLYLHGIQANYDQVWLRTVIAELHGKGRHFADSIKKWALEFKNSNTIPRPKTGCHPKLRSLLTYEPLRKGLENWLSSDAKAKVTPQTFLDKANSLLKPYNVTICLSTARKWLLKELGWVRSRRKQGLYKDGHEREDVVEYRKEFVKRMEDIERRRIKHNDDRPDLNEGEKPLIFYTHDEATFQSHDGTRSVYHPAGEEPFFKKGSGATFMVSDFISEVDGPITSVRKIIEVGKNHDGYWNGEDLARQLEDLVVYHKERYPEYEAIVAFDNACTHSSFAADAPRANKMAVKEGSKSLYRAERMWYMKDGARVPQDYTFKQGKEMIPKGITHILRERGIRAMPSLGKCRKGCPDRPEDSKRPFCCKMQMLSHQPDFKEQRTMVDDIMNKNPGFKAIYYPKFHPELNFIEMFWGMVKRRTRGLCNYSRVGFKIKLIKALDSVKIDTIRAIARRAFRYMRYYREGLTSLQAEWAMKMYTSHRRAREREEKKKLKEKEKNQKSPRWLYNRREALDGVTEGGHVPVTGASTADVHIPAGKTGTLAAYFVGKDSGVSIKQEMSTDGLGCIDQDGRLPTDEADGNDNGTPVKEAPERESTWVQGTLMDYFARTDSVPEENKSTAGPDYVVRDRHTRVGKTGTLTDYFSRKNDSEEEDEVQEWDSDVSDVWTEEEEDCEWYGSDVWTEDEDEKQEQDDSDVSTEEEEEDEQEWEVEKIMGYELQGGIPKWFVKWKGYSEDESTWEPLENLHNALEAIAEFEQKSEK